MTSAQKIYKNIYSLICIQSLIFFFFLKKQIIRRQNAGGDMVLHEFTAIITRRENEFENCISLIIIFNYCLFI